MAFQIMLGDALRVHRISWNQHEVAKANASQEQRLCLEKSGKIHVGTASKMELSMFISGFKPSFMRFDPKIRHIHHFSQTIAKVAQTTFRSHCFQGEEGENAGFNDDKNRNVAAFELGQQLPVAISHLVARSQRQILG